MITKTFSLFSFCMTLLFCLSTSSTVPKHDEIEDYLEDTYNEFQNYLNEKLDTENSIEADINNIIHKENKDTQRQVTNNVQNYEVSANLTEVTQISTKNPIVTSFTIPRPLNNASTTPSITNTFQNIAGFISPKNMKNSITIFHVNAEFENDKDDRAKENAKDFVQNFREYIAGLRNGFVNGISNVSGRHLHFENDKNLDKNFDKRYKKMHKNWDSGNHFGEDESNFKHFNDIN